MKWDDGWTSLSRLWADDGVTLIAEVCLHAGKWTAIIIGRNKLFIPASNTQSEAKQLVEMNLQITQQ